MSPKSSDREYYLFTLKIIGDFGLTLAVPIVLFVLLGQYLDERLGRGPLFTILGFILAALISGRMIWRKAKQYGEIYQKMNEKK